MGSPASIGSGRVLVKYAHPPQLAPEVLARYEGFLSDDERRRHDRFHFARHRLEYLVTRGVVRSSLAPFVGVAPEALRFRSNEYGRPELDPPCGVVFNVSNAPTFVCCAIGAEIELGIDVEPIARGTDVLEVATTVFTEAERAVLDADRAVTLWTVKEAYIKARGLGFALPADRIETVRAADGRWRLHAPRDLDDRGSERFAFVVTDLDAHRVAVAAAVPDSELAVTFVKAT